VAVVGKMLEHQIEQLHRLRDLGFRHWFERSRSWQRTQRITRRRNPQATYYGKLTGSTKIVVTIAISRRRLRAGNSGSCARR
jgi:hypothetical protein